MATVDHPDVPRLPLPRGSRIPPESWRARHRVVRSFLWASLPALVVVGLAGPVPATQTVAGVAVVAALAGVALAVRGPEAKAELTGVALISASFVGIQLSGGQVHAHLFLLSAVALVALYQRWPPLLYTVGAVLVHHLVLGLLAPSNVFGGSEAGPSGGAAWGGMAMSAGDAPSLLAIALMVTAHVLAVAVEVAAILMFWHFAEQSEQVLIRQALTDDLTGLPNRRAFHDRVTALLTGAAAEHAILLLDMNRFKEVNDGLGHAVGDQLLVDVSARLSRGLAADESLARLGGDEFAILLPATGGMAALARAQEIHGRLSEPFLVGGLSVSGAAAIGVALSPAHGDQVSTLMQRADIAMYRAKRARAGPVVYARGDDVHDLDRITLIDELRTALALRQFMLRYQPKVALADGRVRGVEALVRWSHPVRGVLAPGQFLGVLEDAGLMRAMTDQVLEIALDQAKDWHRRNLVLPIAVNLSASTLVDSSLPGVIAAALQSRQLPPAALQLEITEEVLVVDRVRARGILADFRERGVQISLDDFGTGYSSLSYLRDLPIDELKLDRGFVTPMLGDSRAAALVSGTILLAHGLGLRIVAEGVEDAATADMLRSLGCDIAQGYLIAKPLAPEEFEKWLAARVSVLPGPRRRLRSPVARTHVL